jgi:hypothetical protein
MLLSDKLTALNEDQENSDAAVERPQLTNNALMKELRIVVM